MSQALYRKYRPSGWTQVIGQEHIIQTLKNAIAGDHIAHAYLFSGPRGTGKTSTARLLAKAVNCLSTTPKDKPCNKCENCLAVNDNRFLDLIEIDAASNTSVDDVRDLREKINFSPNQGRYKVYIIDEVHMLSTAAFNALLKTLEEPPSHAIFILATTEVHKIPATVLSRCQRYEFRKIPINLITETLLSISKSENFDFEPEALSQIARQSTGALRDAISLLDQLASTGERITLNYTQTVLGTATNELVIEMVNSIINNSPNEGIQTIYSALDTGSDPRQFAKQIVEYLRTMLLIKLNSKSATEITEDVLDSINKQKNKFSTQNLVDSINLFNKAANEIRSGWQPNLPLELAFIESLENIHPSAETMISNSPPVHEQKVTRPSQNISPAKKEKSQTKTAIPVDQKNEKNIPEKPAEDKSVKTEIQKKSQDQNITLEDIIAKWNNIRAQIKKKKRPAEALLNSCKLVSFKNNMLTLGFASDILRARMENKENLELTQEVISSIIGQQISITCVISNKTTGQDKSLEELPPDSLAKTARDLGGRLIQKDNL